MEIDELKKQWEELNARAKDMEAESKRLAKAAKAATSNVSFFNRMNVATVFGGLTSFAVMAYIVHLMPEWPAFVALTAAAVALCLSVYFAVVTKHMCEGFNFEQKTAQLLAQFASFQRIHSLRRTLLLTCYLVCLVAIIIVSFKANNNQATHGLVLGLSIGCAAGLPIVAVGRSRARKLKEQINELAELQKE